jgi:hypothetical protein
MINIEILLIVLGGLCVVLLGVLVKKLSKVKVWVESRQKDNQPFVCTCYLEKGEDGEAAEVHRSGAFGKPAVAIVKVDEKSTLNRGYVDVLMTDMNDDVVNFINNSFKGSFLFKKSEVMNRWFLITPFSKSSWKSEHVIVKDEKMKEFLIKESESGNADSSIVIPSFPSQDVN